MSDHRASPRKPGQVTRLFDNRTDLSAFRRRIPVIFLSICGVVVAATLTLYQLHVLDSIWEPFFGDGSRRVLTSRFSRALPFPDAGLGAIAYALEAVLESLGGPRRVLDAPWTVIAGGLVATGLGAAALGLVVMQAAVIEAFCTLCLASAATSLVIAALVAPELRVAIRTVRTRHRDN